MKEFKFIELLNLYIDRQISPQDSALLEEEILKDPRRRQTYSQYCRMHRACTLVLEQISARNQAERPAATVLAFETPRHARWRYYAAGFAAAACVAFVAVRTVLRPGNASLSPVATVRQSQPALENRAETLVLTTVRMDTSGVRAPSKTEVNIAQQLRLVAPMTMPANHVSVADSASRKMRISPLPAPNAAPDTHQSIEDFVFAPQQAARDNPQIFRGRQSPDDRAEMNAIEYQRQ
jgi:hypothetical protein